MFLRWACFHHLCRIGPQHATGCKVRSCVSYIACTLKLYYWLYVAQIFFRSCRHTRCSNKIQEHIILRSQSLFLTKSWQFFGVWEQLNSAQKWYSEVKQSCFEKNTKHKKTIHLLIFLQLKVSCTSSYLTFQQNGHTWQPRNNSNTWNSQKSKAQPQRNQLDPGNRATSYGLLQQAFHCGAAWIPSFIWWRTVDRERGIFVQLCNAFRAGSPTQAVQHKES